MKIPRLHNWRTTVLAAVACLLPWQTRWMFGFINIDGQITQFGIMSLYAVEVILVVGLIAAYVADGARPRIPVSAAVIAVALFTSLIFAPERLLALTAALHVLTALIFFCALADSAVRLSTVARALCVGLVPSVALGVWQVMAGASGASTLLGLAARDAQTLGDAVVLFNGERVLRAYGVFSHPNIFGGFLAVAMVVWMSFRRHASHLIFWGVTTFFAAGLALTGSRSAILGLAVAFIIWVFRQRSVALRSAISLAVIGLALVGTFALPHAASLLRGGGATEQRSIYERREQYVDAVQVLSSTNLVFGDGVGNYVFTLARVIPDREWWEYQPMHNIPILLVGELGLLGLLAVIVACVKTFRLHAVYGVLCAVAVFDHYLWTTWSGLALVAFCVAFAWRATGEKLLDGQDEVA